MTDERTLDFDELVGELRELIGRVVGLEIRDEHRNLIARAEGEFGHLEGSGREWSFQVGGGEPRESEGIRFEQASWITIELNAGRVAEVRDMATGIGPTFDLHIRLADGTSIIVWPAMPPEQQWTDRHFDSR
jgi:hypothetical protein